ncbi:hypothetical protein GCK72_015831 [Caenorhabditis remanei]|uniref:F-box domain-containing protein n=1 Tax=Caenorhabditis remanei TaxID=31234 RepID=A0A6A5GXN8_CAERE|nr:hypothetical protein GCK72_015831 [Caenorhabditis remanei]KAF1759364.1 hypothetical protein GCK72_015831 [Caenorhabditis remanei]
MSIDLRIFIKTMIGNLRIGRAGIWKSGVTENERMLALPILKFPTLVLRKILKTINIETVIPISLCSRKMYHLVKNFRDKSVKLRINIYGESSSVGIVTPDNHYHGVKVVVERKSRNLESVNINGHLVAMHRSQWHNGWVTYWDDEVKGIQSVIEYLSDLFGIKKVATVTVTPYSFKLLDVIKERQGNDYELGIYLS